MGDELRGQAKQASTSSGVPRSDPQRLLLSATVADQACPLNLKVPNAQTLAAMHESRAMLASQHTRFASADQLFADLEKGRSE